MTDQAVTAALSVEEFQETVAAITREVSKVIVGQDEVVRYVLMCVITGSHALLEGVPGLGKTTLVRALATALNLQFARIQFTPDLMPADVTGTNIMEEEETGRRVFRFQPGPVFANLVLADEINRATPKTQSALLEAMQEKTVTVANRTYKLEPPFFVLATQNPLEMEGTYPLPEAQLDRFMFKIDVGFPSAEELVSILNRTTGGDTDQPQSVADGARIIEMGKVARNVPIATHLSEYVARLIVNSHPDQISAPEMVKKYVRYGASPRGAQSLILGAKLQALFSGRFNVSFEDVRRVARAALRHRMLLNFEGQAEGISTDRIIDDMLQKVPEQAR
ncbi:MAG: MoxR family ATPase [Chloroflexi bacterium CFX4]|nr:MoxR family ATPase [Chloroflexi bacterium CFX4]MDL1922669.1 MoxR family ATPase [Chloroflexi bacterium CFX3]